MTAALYLYNREANCELTVYNTMKIFLFCPVLTYLKVNWTEPSRTVQFESFSSNLTVRRLAGLGWIASARALRTAALSLVYSTAEHCALVWCRGANTRV